MPEARSARRGWAAPVEILNTGHLGYSPEQYYYSLIEYAKRFPPQFVVVSLFANDFGDLQEVLEGRGDWAGGELLAGPDPATICYRRAISSASSFRPPGSTRSKGRKWPGITRARSPTSWKRPGPAISTRSPSSPTPSSRSSTRPKRLGLASPGSPLFNGRIGDGHFSARGCEIWAAAVGRRLALLIEKRDLASAPASGVASRPPTRRCGSNPKSQLPADRRRYSPITLTSTRLGLRPSNSP